MSTDISLDRRCRDQEIAIARLMREAPGAARRERRPARPARGGAPAGRGRRRDRPARGHAARGPGRAGDRPRRPHALAVGPRADRGARGRAAARLRADHQQPPPRRASPRTPRSGSPSSSGAARCASRCATPGPTGVVAPREPDRENGGGFGLHLVDKLATRWGVNRTGGTHVWFEVDAVGRDGLAGSRAPAGRRRARLGERHQPPAVLVPQLQPHRPRTPSHSDSVGTAWKIGFSSCARCRL